MTITANSDFNWRCYIEHFQEEGAPQSGSLRDRCFFTAYETNIIVPLKSLVKALNMELLLSLEYINIRHFKKISVGND